MRNFSAQETEWLEELDGIELASFWRRACAFLVDCLIVNVNMLFCRIRMPIATRPNSR
jgi:hypothetical protein